MTLVYYHKTVRGRLYPKEARKNPRVSFVNANHREGGKVVSRYVGIREAPEKEPIEERDDTQTPGFEGLKKDPAYRDLIRRTVKRAKARKQGWRDRRRRSRKKKSSHDR